MVDAEAGVQAEAEGAEHRDVGVKCVLLDIEGTICPISFVKDTLFPYALTSLPALLATQWNHPDFIPYRDAFPEHARISPATLQAHVEQLTRDDVKVAYHKNLQGYLWETGYREGAYATPLFPDVAPRLRQWWDAGMRLAIYSSGSVFAQKLLFGHVRARELGTVYESGGEGLGRPKKRSIDATTSAAGDSGTQEPPKKVAKEADAKGAHETFATQAPESEQDYGGETNDREHLVKTTSEQGVETEDLQYLISDWFDTTNAGPKKEQSSYEKIADAMELSPTNYLFLTDSVEEYDAAVAAGMQAGLLRRPGNPPVKQEDLDRCKVMQSLENAHPLQ